MNIECWHFLPDDGCMQFGDRQKVEVGITYQIDGPIALSRRGFHGSRRALDALSYAPGALCCRVVIGGDIIENADRLVGHTRTVLWMADATRLLHEFSCDIAEKYLEQNNVTDVRCHQAIQVKRLWLDGKATDAHLGAVRAVVGAAAYDVGWNAIWDMTSAVATDVARVAAIDAARSVTMAAAGHVWSRPDPARLEAWIRAWGAPWSELSDDLEGRLSGLAPQP